MRPLLLTTQEGDWEGLFVNGKLIEEGHTIGEGDPVRFWLTFAHEYKCTGDDIVIAELNDEDNETLMCDGSFSGKKLTDLKGAYYYE